MTQGRGALTQGRKASRGFGKSGGSPGGPARTGMGAPPPQLHANQLFLLCAGLRDKIAGRTPRRSRSSGSASNRFQSRSSGVKQRILGRFRNAGFFAPPLLTQGRGPSTQGRGASTQGGAWKSWKSQDPGIFGNLKNHGNSRIPESSETSRFRESDQWPARRRPSGEGYRGPLTQGP